MAYGREERLQLLNRCLKRLIWAIRQAIAAGLDLNDWVFVVFELMTSDDMRMIQSMTTPGALPNQLPAGTILVMRATKDEMLQMFAERPKLQSALERPLADGMVYVMIQNQRGCTILQQNYLSRTTLAES